MNVNNIKSPQVKYDIHPLIQKRWSPRAFSDKAITEEQLYELFEAARWAPSANNEQPWFYVYAFKDTPGFEQLWDCLLPGNQPWTKSAAVLMIAMKRNTFSGNGASNPWSEHDLGMANAQLFLQAAHHNIYGHLLAGFDKEKVKTVLSIDENIEPVCMAALGYLGDIDTLDEPYKSRELAPRNRMSIQDFTKEM